MCNNIPQLRFPQFSDEWKEKKFGEIFDRITRKNTENYNNALSISAKFGLINQDEYFNKIVASKDLLGYTLIFKNEFAYNKSYSKGYPFGVIKLLSKYSKGVLSPIYICFKAKPKHSVEFLKHFFDSGIFNKEIYKICTEGARNHGLLNISIKSFFTETNINITSLAEQKKIANFFSTVDSKIDLLKEKKSLYEEYKKGLMQQLFPQREDTNPTLRFRDENGNDYPDWEEKKLNDLCNIDKGKQLNRVSLSERGTYKCFSGGQNPSGYTEKFNTDQNTVIISEGGNSCGYVNFIKTKFWCGGHCYKLNNVTINNIYLYYFLKHNEKYIMNLRVGGALPNIQKKDINKFKTFFPSLPEQEKIANFLSTIDLKIELIEKEINLFEEWKKGLLQQMFV